MILAYAFASPARAPAAAVGTGIAGVPRTPSALVAASPCPGTGIPVVPIDRSGIPVGRTHGAVSIAVAVIGIVTACLVLRRRTIGSRRVVLLLGLGSAGETHCQGKGQHHGQAKNEPIPYVHDITLLFWMDLFISPHMRHVLAGVMEVHILKVLPNAYS